MTPQQAINLLMQNGYTEIEPIEAGAYKMSFKCKKSGVPVAATVITSTNPRLIDKEIKAAEEIEKAKPLDYDKYKDFKFDETYKERAKRYYENLNLPAVKKVLFNGNQTAIIESPLMDGDIFKYFIEKSQNKDEIAKNLPIPYNEYKKIALSVLNALTVLHARGMAHFDIKPDNILQLTDADGFTKYQLCDYGFADIVLDPDKNEEKKEETKKRGNDYRRKGSPDYVAPELKSPKSLNAKMIPKVDVYSLGATLFQIFLAKKQDIINAKNLPEAIKKLHRGSIYNNLIEENARQFIDFVKECTMIDPAKRKTAKGALNHEFLK